MVHIYYGLIVFHSVYRHISKQKNVSGLIIKISETFSVYLKVTSKEAPFL